MTQELPAPTPVSLTSCWDELADIADSLRRIDCALERIASALECIDVSLNQPSRHFPPERQ